MGFSAKRSCNEIMLLKTTKIKEERKSLSMKSRIFETACPEQKVILPAVLFCLLVANVLFCMGGFSFTLEPLNNIRILTGYLLPMGLFLSLRNTPAFRFKKTAIIILLSIAVLNLFGLVFAVWGGELNFRKTALSENQDACFRSDINTWHRIIQKEYVRDNSQTIVLEAITEVGIENLRIIKLTYTRTLGGFLQQSKSICKLKNCKDANFTVNESKRTITLKATAESNGMPVEQDFSLDFDAVKPRILKL